jgi:hypothetical protein
MLNNSVITLVSKGKYADKWEDPRTSAYLSP